MSIKQCLHPARDGFHEVYARPDGTSFCRACGAELGEVQGWPQPKADKKERGMSDAPERIWAWTETDGTCVERFWIKNPERVDGSETEYVRADLHEALRAERDDYAYRLNEASSTYTEMHLEIERLRDENARLREADMAALVALKYLQSFGCPACCGYCVSANPPVSRCPAQEIGSAIGLLRAALETKGARNG